VPPGGTVAKLVGCTAVPGHTVEGAGTVAALTVGFGLTVIVYVEGVPVQPFKVGVTVIVPLMGVVPALVAVKPGTFPLPFAATPIPVLLLVHV
jgi:hypothetical protein